MFLAYTTDDGIASQHATRAAAKKAANARTGRIFGHGWDQTTLRIAGVFVLVDEKAERDGRELDALVLPDTPIARSVLADSYGVDATMLAEGLAMSDPE